MKTLAIIGASYLQLPLVYKAKEQGLHTLCFAWTEGAVCKDVADEFFPISIVEKEQILEVCREKSIDGICTIASDVAAPTVAYVAEKMGLAGNPYEVALRASNKYLMRQAFMASWIPSPHSLKITSLDQLDGHELHFPVIVKPTDRSGSLGVAKVERRGDLAGAVTNALACSFSHEAVVEDFIDGREISVEFISYQGVHYPLQITDKVTTGAPYFVEIEHHQPAALSHGLYEKIYALTAKALEALGVNNGASHAEYKITVDGEIYVMEIGARMGGDFIGSDLVKLSTGYDYLDGVIQVALGKFKEPVFGASQSAGVYFLCEETKRLKETIQNATLPQVVRAEITDPVIRAAKCSGDRSGYLIYQSQNKLVL